MFVKDEDDLDREVTLTRRGAVLAKASVILAAVSAVVVLIAVVASTRPPKSCEDSAYRGVCLDGTWGKGELERYFPEYTFECEVGLCSTKARTLDVFLPEFIMDDGDVVGVVVTNNYKSIVGSESFSTLGAFVTLNVALENIEQAKIDSEGTANYGSMRTLDDLSNNINNEKISLSVTRKKDGYSYMLLTKSNIIAVTTMMIIMKDDEEILKRAFKASKTWGG
jgi:hypothetical protein